MRHARKLTPLATPIRQVVTAGSRRRLMGGFVELSTLVMILGTLAAAVVRIR